NIATSLEKTFKSGFAKVAYSYGENKNTVDAGSIAFGSWNNNQHSGDPNNPGLAFANGPPGHRFFVAASYRFEFMKFGATTVSFFTDASTSCEGAGTCNRSYTFSGDANG